MLHGWDSLFGIFVNFRRGVVLDFGPVCANFWCRLPGWIITSLTQSLIQTGLWLHWRWARRGDRILSGRTYHPRDVKANKLTRSPARTLVLCVSMAVRWPTGICTGSLHGKHRPQEPPQEPQIASCLQHVWILQAVFNCGRARVIFIIRWST